MKEGNEDQKRETNNHRIENQPQIQQHTFTIIATAINDQQATNILTRNSSLSNSSHHAAIPSTSPPSSSSPPRATDSAPDPPTLPSPSEPSEPPPLFLRRAIGACARPWRSLDSGRLRLLPRRISFACSESFAGGFSRRGWRCSGSL